jgi:aryl-alcohol dehydrogenase-like predicted oxidoreductase
LERPDVRELAAIHRHGVSILPYFPLASGLLTGKYRRNEPVPQDSRLGGDGLVSGMLRDGIMAKRAPLSDRRLRTVERLEAFAVERGHTLLELAVSWLATQPDVVSVIAGATKPDQVFANAAAADWYLDDDVLTAIDAIVDEEG